MTIIEQFKAGKERKSHFKEDLNVIFVQRDFGAGDDMEVTYIDEIQITDEGKLNKRPKNFFDSWDDVLTRLID